MADDNAMQTDAQSLSAMAAQLKANLAKTKMMKGAPPDPAELAAAAERAQAHYKNLVREQKDEMTRYWEEQEAASRKAKEMISMLQASMRPDLEYLVASETFQAATGKKDERREALRRQRAGVQLLPHEQSMLDASALKPEGPGTNALMRGFNRVSNAMKIRKLYKQDLVSILAEEKAASEAKCGIPLDVTLKRVKKAPSESMARAIVYSMRNP